MLKPFRLLRTCLPLEADDVTAALNSYKALERACPSLPAFVDLLKQSDPIGRLGNYRGIYVLTPTLGGFTPGEGARPVLGEVGTPESSWTVEVKTYIPDDVDETTLACFIDALAELHPWEHPPIEVTISQLWTPEAFGSTAHNSGSRQAKPKL